MQSGNAGSIFTSQCTQHQELKKWLPTAQENVVSEELFMKGRLLERRRNSLEVGARKTNSHWLKVTVTIVNTYFAYPESKNTDKAILLLTDVMGMYINTQLIADQLAGNGYLVVMPDILDNDPVPLPENRPEGFSLQAWLEKSNHQPEFVQPIVDKVLAEMKKQFSPKKIGAVGYCFGAKYVTRLLDGRIDAGYNAHPSFVAIEEVAAIKKPLSIAAAQTDSIFTTELRHQSEAKLIEIGATFQINLYGGVEHGFTVRGDMKNPIHKFAKEQAFMQAVAWFNEYLN